MSAAATGHMARGGAKKSKKPLEDAPIIINDDDIKPLVIDGTENSGMEKSSLKELKVKIETLTLRPASPSPPPKTKGRKQTACRGASFRQGQVVTPRSKNNEWEATKHLVSQSDAQPKSGDIHKLHDTKSDIEESNVTAPKKPKLSVHKENVSVAPKIHKVVDSDN